MSMRDEFRSGRAQRRGRRGCILAAALAVLAILQSIPATAATEGSFRRIGSLPISLGDGIVPDAAKHRILVVQGGAEHLEITVVDPNTMRRGKSVAFPDHYPQWGGPGKPRAQLFDERARRLWLIAYTSAETMNNAVDPHLIAIDVDSMRAVADKQLSAIFPSGARVLGITRQRSGAVLVVAQLEPEVFSPVRAAGVLLAEIDLETASIVWPSSGGPAIVRGCQSAITTYSQSEALSTKDAVVVGCASAQAGALATPGVQGVVAVDRGDPSQQRFFFLPGTYGSGEAYADTKAGRLLLVGPSPGSPAQAVWVFDAAHSVFVGQVAPGDLGVLGAGLNSSNGRLYMGATGAVLVTSGRGYTIPQALSFPAETNLGPITAIPFNSTVVVPLRGSNGWVFGVYRDSIPDDEFAESKPVDYSALDRETANSAQYSADAQAFGVRLHRIGGIDNAAQNVFTTGGSYWTTIANLTGLKDGDRNLYLSRITRLHLSADEASAESLAADPDANTRADHETIRKLERCPPAESGATGPCVRPLENIVAEWPYQAAACGDFSGAKPKHADAAGDVSGMGAGESSADCSLSDRIASASSSFGTASFGSLISIGSSSSGATITQTVRGLSLAAFSEIRNLTISPPNGASSDSVHIGLIRSEVTAGASGASAKATGTYKRIFESVIAGSYRCGTLSSSTPCDPAEALAAISEQLGSQVRVELPLASQLATAKGAHGHAFRDPWEQQQDIVVNNEDDTQHQVPALRVTFVNDRSLASRLIVDFAATAGDATSLRVVPEKPIVVPTIDVPTPRLPYPVETPPVVIDPPKPPPAGFVTKVINTIGHGWKVLTAGRSGMLARSIALWLLFASPLFFGLRRRVLRHVGSGW